MWFSRTRIGLSISEALIRNVFMDWSVCHWLSVVFKRVLDLACQRCGGRSSLLGALYLWLSHLFSVHRDLGAIIPHAMPVRIAECSWVVFAVSVEVQALRVAEIGVRNGDWLRCPIGSQESSGPVSIISSAEVIQPSFRVPLLAVELVVIGIAVDEPDFPAPGIVILILHDGSG